jgi:hypothetical protein
MIDYSISETITYTDYIIARGINGPAFNYRMSMILNELYQLIPSYHDISHHIESSNAMTAVNRRAVYLNNLSSTNLDYRGLKFGTYV